MVIYERHISFSILRGFIYSVAPIALAYAGLVAYYAGAYGLTLPHATHEASQDLARWYREYPVALLGTHLFLFALTIGYRRRVVNNWANGVMLLGVVALAGGWYYQMNKAKGLDPFRRIILEDQHRLSGNDFEDISVASPMLAPAVQRSGHIETAAPPNELWDSQPPTEGARPVLWPDSRGDYTAKVMVGANTVNFELAPDSWVTTLGSERLAEFPGLACAPQAFDTSDGRVDGCVATLPDVAIGDLHVKRAKVAFIVGMVDHAFLGRDLLNRFGARRIGKSIVLGKAH